MGASYRVLIDERDPATPFTITGENHTIPTSESVGVARVYLNEIPLKETPSSVTAKIGTTTLTEITTDPSATTTDFKVVYKETFNGRWAGMLRLHSTQKGQTVTVDYKGIGTSTIAQDITDIQNQKLDSDAAFRQLLRSGSSTVGPRHLLNFIPGPGIGISLEDVAGSNRTDVIISTSVGTVPPNDAAYIVGTLNASLTAERLLTAGAGIVMTDGGANSNWTVAQIADSTTQKVEVLQSNTSKGTRSAINFIAGDVNTFLQVTDNTTTNRIDVLWSTGQAAGAPASEPYVVMTLSSVLTNERKLTAGGNIKLVDGGANGNATISLDSASQLRWLIAQEIQLADLQSSSVTNVLTLIHSANPVSAANTFETDTGGTLPTSLIAYWKLDETSGTRTDSKGSNNLTSFFGVTSAEGKKSNAALFAKASTQYLNIADNAALSTGDIDFSFDCYVYPTVNTNNVIIGKRTGADADSEYSLELDGNSKAVFSVWSTGSAQTSVTSTSTIPLNQWTFIACWHDSVNNQLGIKINNSANDIVSYANGVRDGTLSFNLGANSVPGGYFDGRIDEVGFWKKVLSATELADLYNSGNANTYNPTAGGGLGVSGIGVRQVFQTEDSAGNLDDIGQVDWVHGNATSGSEDSYMTISLRSAGSALVEFARLSSSGLSVEREMLHIGDKNVGARGRFVKVYSSNPANPPIGEVDWFVLDSGSGAKVFKVRYNSSGTILEAHEVLS